MRGYEELKEWIDPVVNHFWYCCQMAEGSVEDLKVIVYMLLFRMPKVCTVIIYAHLGLADKYVMV